MAAKTIQSRLNEVPGTIYPNKNRYWWKVQLPGESKPTARPLKNPGSKFATTDYLAAVELAKNLYQQSIYTGQILKADMPVSNIASLAAAYLCHVDSYYLDGQGNPTNEPDNIRYSFKPLTDLFAALPVEEFGPLRLMEVRDLMIQNKWSRNLINQRIGRIKRMFKWAVSRQLLSPVLYQGLNTVEGLKRGRTTAEEPEKRKPVDENHVYATLAHTTPVVAAMVELQLLTGMRPGELVIMRPCDIDRSDKVWHYTPTRHKTQYRGDERIVSIGPRGQDLLRPFLLRGAESYCFSPAESENSVVKS